MWVTGFVFIIGLSVMAVVYMLENRKEDK